MRVTFHRSSWSEVIILVKIGHTIAKICEWWSLIWWRTWYHLNLSADARMDIYEFCYLVVSAVKHLLAIRGIVIQLAILSMWSNNIHNVDDIKSEKPLLAALKKFLFVSAVSCIAKREVWTRKSADTLSFYFEGARLAGLTEKQLAIRACSLDTSGNSPYKQPVVLPGLPPGDGSKGSSMVASLAPCTIVPPLPSEVGGKRLSKCTILPYEGGFASLVEGHRRRTVPFQSVAKPVINKRATFTLGPYASKLALGDDIKKWDKQAGNKAQKKTDAQNKVRCVAIILLFAFWNCAGLEKHAERVGTEAKTTWKTLAFQTAWFSRLPWANDHIWRAN